LKYFREEYEAHIYDKTCPAKKCIALLKFEIDPEKCTSCGMCYKHCPVGAISWQKKEPAVIDKDKCIKCMTCFEKCMFDAIY
ncbi:MAG TPA: 4Fe-4S binding protein, partial [Desulfohalobiaceae bacterium]|nr:4Fe-4S binding protein [Desulfohalobiaceae bacterium]